MEQQRVLLDQLLGSSRNLVANQIPEAEKKFFDPFLLRQPRVVSTQNIVTTLSFRDSSLK